MNRSRIAHRRTTIQRYGESQAVAPSACRGKPAGYWGDVGSRDAGVGPGKVRRIGKVPYQLSASLYTPDMNIAMRRMSVMINSATKAQTAKPATMASTASARLASS